MKTYEEMAQCALARIKAERAAEQARRSTRIKAAASVVSVCLVVVLGLGLWQSGRLSQGTPPVDTANVSEADASSVPATHVPGETSGVAEEPADTDTENGEVSVVSPSGGDVSLPIPDTQENLCLLYWHNKVCTGALCEAFTQEPTRLHTVRATYRPATAAVTDFFYEGKSLAAWATEAYEAGASQAAREGYARAYAAYWDSLVPSMIDRWSDYQIACERAADVPYGLLLHVTAEEMASLPQEETKDWYFDLASDTASGAGDLAEFVDDGITG